MSKYSRRLLYKERAVPIRCDLCGLAGHGTYLTTDKGYAHLICLNRQWNDLMQLKLKSNEKQQDENLTELDKS